jgi:hypothetical protein
VTSGMIMFDVTLIFKFQKTIFSSLIHYNDSAYYGSYDGQADGGDSHDFIFLCH